jgi:iron complex transport system substrate-binding protein
MRRLALAVTTAFALLAAFVLAPPLAAAPTTRAAGDDAASIRYSKGFSIESRPGYRILRVLSPWPGARRGFSYVLYDRGSPRPRGVEADAFFEVPLRRAVALSTTYLPMIVELGAADSVVGVDSAASVSTPAIRARVASGRTVETSRNGNPNIELLISLGPDAIFAYGMGNEWDAHPKLAEAGLPVVLVGEWNEAEPLARAEWIKFVAAFYGKDAEAATRFELIAREYERIRALAAGAKEKPRVLVNGPFQGTWAVSGGRSYMARFLADAGGDYLWADDQSTGGLVLSIEAAYERARRAELWLNPALSVRRLSDIAALDPRLASLPAVAAGQVWNNDLRLSPGGGSDYFESATVNPDKVLVDLVKILHPELLADRSYTYYRKVGR